MGRNAKDAGLPSGAGQNWTKLLLRAWSNYCAEVPTHERNIDNFIKAIPQRRRNSTGEQSPKMTSAAYPKLGPIAQASPKLAPTVASPKTTPTSTSPKMMPAAESEKNKKGKKRKL